MLNATCGGIGAARAADGAARAADGDLCAADHPLHSEAAYSDELSGPSGELWWPFPLSRACWGEHDRFLPRALLVGSMTAIAAARATGGARRRGGASIAQVAPRSGVKGMGSCGGKSNSFRAETAAG